MPSTKEIKNRIKSVSDTQKITNAMYLISSTKMRRARKEAEETKPYFDLLRNHSPWQRLQNLLQVLSISTHQNFFLIPQCYSSSSSTLKSKLSKFSS